MNLESILMFRNLRQLKCTSGTIEREFEIEF